MTQFNAHRLFFWFGEEPCYHRNLTVSDKRLNELREARDAARKAVTDGFDGWEKLIEKKALFEDSAKAANSNARLQPKFRGQGSYSYKTLNDPAHTPPQQVDFDDGIFLPISFFEGTGARPVVASKGYFALVEKALQPLCQKKGWKIEQKPSCVRLKLSKGAHLDLALYAIKDLDFEHLVTASLAKAAGRRALVQDELVLDEDIYEKLADNDIVLAHRDDGWMPSDPRKLEAWFKQAIDTHGEQLRRVCRYLKGWRDYTWPAGSKVSSIAIMKCVVDAYDSLTGDFDQKRDDAAILMVAQRLPSFFQNRGGIENPVILQPRTILNGNWSDVERTEYFQAARTLEANVKFAIEGATSADSAIAALQKMFGDRLPTAPERLNLGAREATIKQYPAVKTPAPHVPKTTSG
jgi:hypothetical protein